MSTLCPASRKDPDAPPPAVEFHYTQTENFAPLLQELRVSLLVSTYQANKLLIVRANGGGLSTLVRTFERPMGMAVDGRRLTLATRNAIWVMRNAPDLAPRIDPVGEHDACYVPRSCHLTGDIGVHEIAWAPHPPAPSPTEGRGGARGEGQSAVLVCLPSPPGGRGAGGEGVGPGAATGVFLP